MRKGRVNNATADLTPAVGVFATDDDDICRHAQISQGAMQTNRLLSLVSDLRLYDQEVDVAPRSGLSTSVGVS